MPNQIKRTNHTPRRRGAAAAAQAASTTVSIASLNAMGEQEFSDEIDRIVSTVKNDPNQQPDSDEVQKFFNAIGWTNDTPTLVADEEELEAAKQRGEVQGPYLYHTDAPTGLTDDAQRFADQYQGSGRQFVSGGVMGDGTYWANDPNDSWNYSNGGRNRAYMQKGMLNKNAKSITNTQLTKEIKKFQKKYPQKYRRIMALNGASGYSSYDSVQSIFAALLGYNVVRSGYGYYVVLNRSATTVVKGGHHGHRRGGRPTFDYE